MTPIEKLDSIISELINADLTVLSPEVRKIISICDRDMITKLKELREMLYNPVIISDGSEVSEEYMDQILRNFRSGVISLDFPTSPTPKAKELEWFGDYGYYQSKYGVVELAPCEWEAQYSTAENKIILGKFIDRESAQKCCDEHFEKLVLGCLEVKNTLANFY